MKIICFCGLFIVRKKILCKITLFEDEIVNTELLYNILNLQEVDSTNLYAVKNLATLSDKQIIVADRQTEGKGRLSRSWISEKEDNVYMSIILKPSSQMDSALPLPNITQYMSVVLCKVLEDFGINSQIKWPNDVLVDKKKIAGILSHLSVQGNHLKGFVLGLGVNLNLDIEDITNIDQPATSLNLLLDKPIHRDSFIEVLLNKFFENYELFMQTGFSLIKNEYEERSFFIGNNISVNTPQSKINGIAKELTNEGSLIVHTDNNEEITVNMGDLICF